VRDKLESGDWESNYGEMGRKEGMSQREENKMWTNKTKSESELTVGEKLEIISGDKWT